MNLHISAAIVLVLLLIAGCSDSPTPLPIDLPPTATPTPESGDVPQPPTAVRLLFAEHVDTAVPDADRTILDAEGIILENAPSQRLLDGAIVDLAPSEVFVRFTDPNLDNARFFVSPGVLNRSVAFNPAALPFDQAAVLPVFRESFSVSANDPRTVLAQAGYPDGFDLNVLAVNGFDRVGYDLQVLFGRFLNAPVSIDSYSQTEAQRRFQGSTYHLAIFSWGDSSVRDEWITIVGAENVVDLPALTILYQLGSGVTVTEFTPGGFPIPRRNP